MTLRSFLVTVTAGLLNVLVEAALTDDDNDVRTAAIKLVSDLWKKPYAIDRMFLLRVSVLEFVSDRIHR